MAETKEDICELMKQAGIKEVIDDVATLTPEDIENMKRLIRKHNLWKCSGIPIGTHHITEPINIGNDILPIGISELENE